MRYNGGHYRKIGQICSFVIPLGAVGAVELVSLVKSVRPEYASIVDGSYIDFIIFNFALGISLLTTSFILYVLDDIHQIQLTSSLYRLNRWVFFTVGIIAVFYTMINSLALHFGGKIGQGHILQLIPLVGIIILIKEMIIVNPNDFGQ